MALKKLFRWAAKQKASDEQLPESLDSMNLCSDSTEEAFVDGYVCIGKAGRSLSKTTVMAVGKPRNGKSSVLNNIFGLKLEAGPSVKLLTQQVSVTDSQREDELFQVIDTPGLGSLEISDEEVLEGMRSATQGNKFTLMYCFSISPNTLLDETDKAILQQLHTSLGEHIWKNCIVLMTFSDFACDEIDSEELYIEHVRSHTREFQSLLRSIWKESPTVTSVFDRGKNSIEPEIIAIPVMKRKNGSCSILPGLLKETQNWTDVVIDHILKLSEIT